MKSEQINEIAAALAKAQASMRNAPMDGINPHFRSRYATLASVLDAIRKPLSDNGLAISQTLEVQGSGMILTTILMHVSGQWLSSEYPLPIGKPQEMGSAQTYARRYSLAALVCNSSEEDDDANAAQAAKNGKAETISDDQIVYLKDLFAGLKNADPRMQTAFLKALGVTAYAEIPASEYERAVTMLQNKAKQS